MPLIDLLVGDRRRACFVCRDAFGRVVVVLAAEAHDDVGNAPAETMVLRFVARFERSASFARPSFSRCVGLGAEAVGFLVIERAHVGFGDGGGRAQNALLTATGAGAVAGDERFVIAPHHQMIAQAPLRANPAASSSL